MKGKRDRKLNTHNIRKTDPITLTTPFFKNPIEYRISTDKSL